MRAFFKIGIPLRRPWFSGLQRLTVLAVLTLHPKINTKKLLAARKKSGRFGPVIRNPCESVVAVLVPGLCMASVFCRMYSIRP